MTTRYRATLLIVLAGSAVLADAASAQLRILRWYRERNEPSDHRPSTAAPRPAPHGPSHSAAASSMTLEQQFAALQRMRTRALQTRDVALLERTTRALQGVQAKLAQQNRIQQQGVQPPMHAQAQTKPPRFMGPPQPPPDIEETETLQAQRQQRPPALEKRILEKPVLEKPILEKPILEKPIVRQAMRPELPQDVSVPAFNAPEITGPTVGGKVLR